VGVVIAASDTSHKREGRMLRLSLTKAVARPAVRALSARAAPQAAAASSASGNKAKKPAKIKTFKIWRYDPEQKNQKPYSVD